MQEFRIDLWTDGSYNMMTKTYGSAFLADMYVREDSDSEWNNIPDGIYRYSGFAKDETGMQSCAGEIAAVLKAVEFVKDAKKANLNVVYVRILHDHIGLANWVSGVFRTEKKYTTVYRELVHEAQRELGLKFEFVHVKGHSKVKFNDEVDYLAKKACGVVR